MAQTATVPHDRPEQLRMIQDAALPNEEIVAVYDCKGAGTGFLGLTNRRVILEDRSFVGNKIALISLPYSRIASVAVLTNKSVLGTFFSSAELLIVTMGGSHHKAEFRGTDKCRFAHDYVLWRLDA